MTTPYPEKLVGELRAKLDDIRLPLTATETPDYAEIHDEDGIKIALTVKPDLICDSVNALPTLLTALTAAQERIAALESTVEFVLPGLKVLQNMCRTKDFIIGTKKAADMLEAARAALQTGEPTS